MVWLLIILSLYVVIRNFVYVFDIKLITKIRG